MTNDDLLMGATKSQVRTYRVQRSHFANHENACRAAGIKDAETFKPTPKEAREFVEKK